MYATGKFGKLKLFFVLAVLAAVFTPLVAAVNCAHTLEGEGIKQMQVGDCVKLVSPLSTAASGAQGAIFKLESITGNPGVKQANLNVYKLDGTLLMPFVFTESSGGGVKAPVRGGYTLAYRQFVASAISDTSSGYLLEVYAGIFPGWKEFMQIGDRAQFADNFYAVLKDVSGMPYGVTYKPAASFDLFKNGVKIDSFTLQSGTGNLYNANGATILLTNAFVGTGGSAYAQVAFKPVLTPTPSPSASPWPTIPPGCETRWEFMQIGDSAVFPHNGVKVTLKDISGMPYGTSYSLAAGFDVFDSNGNKIDTATLQRGVEYNKNGARFGVLNVFAGTGGSAYADTYFCPRAVRSTSTPTPYPVRIINTDSSHSMWSPGCNAAAPAGDAARNLVSFRRDWKDCATGAIIERQLIYTNGGYCNVECANRYKEQCIDDGSFDTFYDEFACVYGNGTPSPTPTVYPSEYPTIPPLPENQFVITLNAGWNMVSSPVIENTPADASDAQAFYGSRIISTDCAATALWNWNGKSYETPGRNVVGTVLAPIKGYWIYSSAPCAITVQGDRGASAEGAALHAGWNQIGAPYAKTDFASLAQNCKILSGPWGYDSTRGYFKETALVPGNGYFVKVASNCVLGQTDANPPNPPSGYDRNNGRAGGSSGSSSRSEGDSDGNKK